VRRPAATSASAVGGGQAEADAAVKFHAG
jgi:hypothetical protein